MAESAEESRGRVRELVEEAARRLGVEIGPRVEPESTLELPAALDEFVSLIGAADGDLAGAWFPGERVGAGILSPGREWAFALARLPANLLDDAVFLMLDPSGTVVWVENDEGEDPAVRFITEASTEPEVWSESLTGWLERVMPDEDGELPVWDTDP